MKNISDSIILWANLLILFLLFLKFAVKPLIGKLKGHKKKLMEEVADLERKKDKIISEINDIDQAINEKGSILKNAGENIIKKAEKKRSEIIEEAEHESDLILSRAKQKANDRLLHEKEKLYREIRSEIMSENTDAVISKMLGNKPNDIYKKDD